jgi:hypothetical protein
MANLTISSVCNLDCPYCFTQDHREGVRTGNGFVEVAAFETWLDFVERSEIDQVRLLGGEPTLHPQFPELVARARGRGKRVMVFSNGLMPEKALACLEGLAPGEGAVLVNVNEPALEREQVQERRRATIRRLGERALLGFNIYRADFQAEFLLEIVGETGCQPVIRLGMAQPCLSGRNAHIRPSQYRFIGVKIVGLAQAAAERGIRLEFDCGFVRCMFTEGELETLEGLGTDVGWRCNPVLDVDIGGRVVHCYPLARFMSLPLTPEVEAAGLRKAFEARTRPYREAGVFRECSSCVWKGRGECSGGCLAVTMRRFRHVPFEVRV